MELYRGLIISSINIDYIIFTWLEKFYKEGFVVRAGIILKTVERCNIDCTYCYYFNSKDQSYKIKKPYITQDMVRYFVDFLKLGIEELKLTELSIELHGGEPLMQKKSEFSAMCSTIRSELENYEDLKFEFSMQTNGMLIDNEWIELLKEHQVGIGISLDGNKEANDVYRVDKKGRGTFDRVIEKIKLCQSAKFNFGLLSVINPTVSGKEMYRYFVDELNIKYIDFLLPDANYSTIWSYPPEKYGEFMIEVFEEWIKDNHDKCKVFVRFCANMVEMFFGANSRLEGFGRRVQNALPLICVSNNGDLGPLDELRTCVPEMFSKYNIKTTSWKEFLRDEFFNTFLYNMQNTPADCRDCSWEKVCGGGIYGHRYDDELKTFSNKSVYCEGLKMFYKRVLEYFLNNGYTHTQMAQFLSIN